MLKPEYTDRDTSSTPKIIQPSFFDDSAFFEDIPEVEHEAVIEVKIEQWKGAPIRPFGEYECNWWYDEALGDIMSQRGWSDDNPAQLEAGIELLELHLSGGAH